ncbi:MAG: very short patch repair endonuclease [Sedimentisphaerales bacterium]|nr:very short patch repair endonuclease [Sedimentisphaerales bacterium]
MKAIPSQDTGPEKKLRSFLHDTGLRFRKDVEPIPGIRCKADIVFRKTKLCIFIDGCFWHGCPLHFKPPKTNSEWWVEKINDNVERDRRKTLLIESNGWTVLRYWEHEINSEIISDIAQNVIRLVKR